MQKWWKITAVAAVWKWNNVPVSLYLLSKNEEVLDEIKSEL